MHPVAAQSVCRTDREIAKEVLDASYNYSLVDHAGGRLIVGMHLSTDPDDDISLTQAYRSSIFCSVQVDDPI